ncbi:unnamed protein product [Triticum turgidum subsp. durum]|uniref:GTD-binding domain-containing protein n=1 Tax=Triticum turgidum subsp. durum TaxID=4567 RepID=A0A9R0TZI7_TRITD|nr:unnamed protein product [Triticum turgidum subsp. durum]
MEVKAMVDDNDEDQQQFTTPVEKEFEYTVDVRCASPKMAAVAVVGEYVGDVAGNAGGLYARVEVLEADRAAMHREIAALRAERAQLVMAREMARRLCWEVVSERKSIVNKAVVPAKRFSALGICKFHCVLVFLGNFGCASVINGFSLGNFGCASDEMRCKSWLVVALRNLLEKKLYYQVYVWLVNYVPWPPAAPRQIHHVESMVASA